MRDHKTDVLIVGAGPVGLLTALVLGEAGLKVEVIDREERTTTRSYACALHPRTLDLLHGLGLADELLQRGRRVSTMAFYDREVRCAEIKLSELGGAFPFLLVLPQSALEAILQNRLRQKALLAVNWSHRFDGLDVEAQEVVAAVEKLGGTATGYIVPHWETVVLKRLPVRAQFLVGADGHNSLVRQRLGVEYMRVAGAESFAAIEFTPDTKVPDEVRVVLDDTTTNVLWPLPGGRCRWTLQLLHSESEFPDKERRAARFADQTADDDLRRWLQAAAARRAPWFSAGVKEIIWCTQVGFEHRLAKRFGQGRCWLAGDAAHQTGPVGMQSLNVGLYEAATLARKLIRVFRQEAPLDALANYDQVQREEWERLLGLSGGLRPKDGAGAWVRQRCARILPCLPGSGEDLARLADQLELGVTQRGGEPVLCATGS